MVITRIEALPRRPDRVRLHFEQGRPLVLGRLAVEEAGLRPGLTLDAARLAELQGRDLFEGTLDRALRFLESRPRSEKEVRQRLAQKGTAPDLIDTVVERLRDLNLIDDAAFAQYWVENRARFRPRGARLLKAELRQKGLSPGLVAEVEGEVDEASGARDVALRQAQRLRNLDWQTFRQKLWAQLARKGFDYDVIGPAIDEAWQEVNGESEPRG